MYIALRKGVVVSIQKNGEFNLDKVEYDTVKKFADDFNNGGINFDIGWEFQVVPKEHMQCFFPPHPSMVPPPDQPHQVFTQGPDGNPVLVENPEE